MQKKIHPAIYDVVFTDISSGAQFISTSTMKSEETTKIGGKEYFVIKVEISSDTHPFFTGKQKLLDTAGRVDRFRAKMEKAKKHKGETVEEKTVEKEAPAKAEVKEETKAEEVKAEGTAE